MRPIAGSAVSSPTIRYQSAGGRDDPAAAGRREAIAGTGPLRPGTGQALVAVPDEVDVHLGGRGVESPHGVGADLRLERGVGPLEAPAAGVDGQVEVTVRAREDQLDVGHPGRVARVDLDAASGERDAAHAGG